MTSYWVRSAEEDLITAKMTSISFTKEQLDLLDDLTAFNISARYEDYKFEMYKKADDKYTKNYLEKTEELFLWLKQKL